MVAMLAAAMLVTLAPQRQTDTTIAVPAGASLSVNNFGGGITVHGWSENRVKVHAETGRRGRVEVSLVGNTVVVKASSREGAPSVMDFDITVPQSMGINLSGTYADITVDGVQGPINAETVNGEVNVRGGKGIITLHSIQGSVTLADASGRIEVNSVNEDIELTNVSGEIKVETTNGGIMMTGIQSSSVDAGTINGDVVYEGTVTDGGSYSFGSHNGDISVSIPERANVTVTTATANGDIDANPFDLQRAVVERVRHGEGPGLQLARPDRGREAAGSEGCERRHPRGIGERRRGGGERTQARAVLRSRRGGDQGRGVERRSHDLRGLPHPATGSSRKHL